MIDNALVVIIFMYVLSFSFLGVQYMLADTLGITMTSISGETLRPNILASTNIDRLDAIARDASDTSIDAIEDNPVLAAASIAWDILQILTGTYIFTVLLLLDIPHIFVSMIVIIYTLLMVRTVIAYLRGI